MGSRDRTSESRTIAEYVRFKRVIQLERHEPQLHGYFGVPGHIDKSTKYVYIIKKLFKPFPKFDTYEEAEAQMPYHVYVGTFNGRYARCILETLQAQMIYMRNIFVDPTGFSLTNSGSLLDLSYYTHSLFMKKLAYEFPENLTEIYEIINLEDVFIPKILCVNKEMMLCEMLRKEESILFDPCYTDVYHVTHETVMDEDLNPLYCEAHTLETILYVNVNDIEDRELAESFLTIRNNITNAGMDLSININNLGQQLMKKRFAHCIRGVIEAIIRNILDNKD